MNRKIDWASVLAISGGLLGLGLGISPLPAIWILTAVPLVIAGLCLELRKKIGLFGIGTGLCLGAGIIVIVTSLMEINRNWVFTAVLCLFVGFGIQMIALGRSRQ